MGLTVTSAACARTVPPVTRAMEYAHVPVAGQVQPVNSVSVTDAADVCDLIFFLICPHQILYCSLLFLVQSKLLLRKSVDLLLKCALNLLART